MSKKKFTKDDIAFAGAFAVMQWFGNKRTDDPDFHEKQAALIVTILKYFADEVDAEKLMEIEQIAGEAAVLVLNGIDLIDQHDDDNKSVKADQEAEDAEDEENESKEIAFEVTTTSNDEGYEIIGAKPKSITTVSDCECLAVIASLVAHMAMAGMDEDYLAGQIADLVKDAFAKTKDIKKCRMV